MIPDSKLYHPDPEYLKELIRSSGMSQSRVADTIGVKVRALRRMLASRDAKTAQNATYVVQFALECLADACTRGRYTSTRWTDMESLKYIELVGMDEEGPSLYAVRNGYGYALGRDGEWHIEPAPGSRDNDFLDICRFSSRHAAFSALNADLARVEELRPE